MEAGGGRRWGPGADAGADAGAEVRACPGVFGTKEDVCDLSIPTGGSQGVSGGTRRRPPSDRDPPDPASDGGPPRSGRGVRVRGAAFAFGGRRRTPQRLPEAGDPTPGLGNVTPGPAARCDTPGAGGAAEPHSPASENVTLGATACATVTMTPPTGANVTLRLQARTECDVIRAPAPGASGRRPAPAPGAPAKADHPHPDDAPARRTRPSQTSVANPRRRAHAREVRNSLHSDFSVSPATAAHDFAALSGPGRASSPPARTSAQLGPAFSLTGV